MLRANRYSKHYFILVAHDYTSELLKDKLTCFRLHTDILNDDILVGVW